MLDDKINQASGCFSSISVLIPKATTKNHKTILVMKKTLTKLFPYPKWTLLQSFTCPSTASLYI